MAKELAEVKKSEGEEPAVILGTQEDEIKELMDQVTVFRKEKDEILD